MSFQESQMYCPHCVRHVIVRRPGPNHILHAVLSLLTCGLWIPIWLLQMIRFGGWYCSQCGNFGVTDQ